MVAEVYTLTLLLWAAALLLLLVWRNRRASSPVTGGPHPSDWLLPWAGGLFGLALGAHHVTAVVVLPALLVFVARTAGARFLSRRAMGWTALAAVVATAAAYAWLPISAARKPALNWGDPSSLASLARHVTGAQYQVNFFSEGADVARELAGFGLSVALALAWVGIPLALVGLVRLRGRDRALFWAFLLVVLCDGLYSAGYSIAEDKDAYHLPAVAVAAVCLGYGWGGVAGFCRKFGPAASRAIAAAALLFPVALCPLRFGDADRSGYTLARCYARDVLSTVDEGGLLLTLDWQFYSPYLYLRHVEGFRGDAAVVDLNMMRRVWYVSEYLPRTYPDAFKSCSAQLADFLEDLRLFEGGKPYDPGRIQARFEALVDALVRHHVRAGSGAWMTLPSEPGIGRGFQWLPDGLCIRLVDEGATNIGSLFRPRVFGTPWSARVPQGDIPARDKVIPSYSNALVNQGRYLAASGDPSGAMAACLAALAVRPRSDDAYCLMGDLFASAGLGTPARAAYSRAAEANPENGRAPAAIRRLPAR